MNEAWVPVLTGILTAVAALGGAFIANYFTLRRDREQWQRQQSAERDKWERERVEQARTRLRDIYLNCLRSIAEFEQIDGRGAYLGGNEEEKQPHYDALDASFLRVQEALWLLLSHLDGFGVPDLQGFHREAQKVLTERHPFLPENFRKLVVGLALQDARLHDPALLSLSPEALAPPSRSGSENP